MRTGNQLSALSRACLFGIALSCVSCCGRPTVKQMMAIKIGMTQDEVRLALGNPEKIKKWDMVAFPPTMPEREMVVAKSKYISETWQYCAADIFFDMNLKVMKIKEK